MWYVIIQIGITWTSLYLNISVDYIENNKHSDSMRVSQDGEIDKSFIFSGGDERKRKKRV